MIFTVARPLEVPVSILGALLALTLSACSSPGKGGSASPGTRGSSSHGGTSTGTSAGASGGGSGGASSRSDSASSSSAASSGSVLADSGASGTSDAGGSGSGDAGASGTGSGSGALPPPATCTSPSLHGTTAMGRALTYARATMPITIDQFGDGTRMIAPVDFDTVYTSPMIFSSVQPWPAQIGLISSFAMAEDSYVSLVFTIPSGYFEGLGKPAYGLYSVGESQFSALVSMTLSTSCGDFSDPTVSGSTVIPGCRLNKGAADSGLRWTSSSPGECQLFSGATYYLNIINADIWRMRLRRMKKMPKTAARLAPVAGTPHGEELLSSSACVALVPITSVAVEEPPAVSVTLPGLTAQVPLVGMPEQVSVTPPLKLALAARFNVTTP